MLRIPSVLLVLFASAVHAELPAEEVQIGQMRIRLVAPEGFERGARSGADWEQYREGLINPSNRLLGYYRPRPNGGEAAEAIFHVQTPRGIEEIECSIEQFGEMAHAISAQFLAEAAGAGEKNVATLLAEAREDPLPATAQGDSGTLSPGETRSLGVYDRSEHHVSFAIVASRATGGKQSHQSNYTAASMCNVGGKIVNLYCSVPAGSEEEALWARQHLARWRQAIQASNPAPLPEETVGRGSFRFRLLIGLCASGMAACFLGLVHRWKPAETRSHLEADGS